MFVDDDVNLLASYRRQFGRRYEVQVAAGGDDGLERLKKKGCALVVADMYMPGMNGIEFLTRARTLSPDTVRMMLIGASDLTTAVNAVNQDNIFRFLSKPCPRDTIEAAVQAGLEQYRLWESSLTSPSRNALSARRSRRKSSSAASWHRHPSGSC